jgi:dienelactone hydrolase
MKVLLRLTLAVSVVSAVSPVKSSAAELPNTKPLALDGNLSEMQVAGMHKYLDRALAASVEKRAALWKPDFTSPESYAKSVAPNRERLRKMLGVVDERLPPNVEYLGGPSHSALVAETPKYKVFAIRWAVLPGVDGEGLLLEPKAEAVGVVVAVPDAGQTPEQLVGLAPGVPAQAQFARRLAEHGVRVVVPTLIDRKDDLSANPKLGRATNQPHREFVHRMAFEMGRTLIGYEVQKLLAVVDWVSATKDRPKVGVFGYGEGGGIALYAAALDPRIDVAVVSGWVGPKEKTIDDEPIYRNVWGLLTEFGDADAMRLIVPRRLIVEASALTADAGPAARPGRGGAAPGKIDAPGMLAVRGEMARALGSLEKEWKHPREETSLLAGGEVKVGEVFLGPCLSGTLAGMLTSLSGKAVKPANPGDDPTESRKDFDPAARHKRQFDQLVAHIQKLWRDSEATRKAFWARADAKSPEAWEKSADPYREYFHSEVIGKLPEPTVPLNPRTRQVYDEKTWTGHEVVLDCYEDVFAYGILLLPKDLKPGEKRPVVVCQHGLEGTPRDTIEVEKRPVYNHFSRRLVELGYIVYAPQNPYYGKNTFRQLQRKANPLKLSLFSFIIRQHQRTLDWLETLPQVDAKRIAFYGLSYGGKTAMRVPAVEKRYCLSICSGDFNEWIGKNVSIDLDRSYMWTGEYEMYEFDLGNTFNYAEMAYLIAPRPFMVERGHDDGVGTDEMVAYEYAKVRYLYANRLKLPERTTIEWFAGGHQINAKETFAFLKQKLDFPK